MRVTNLILALILIPVLAGAQPVFKTVIPRQPVVEGEPFQVQYVLTGADQTNTVRTPVFEGLRLISGPNIYRGSANNAKGQEPVQNFVFTLLALRPGRFVIPAALVAINNKPLQSNEVMLQVISREEAARKAGNKEQQFNTATMLSPGEDPFKKIRENLFVRVQVDKRSCRVGEPVLAIFKLYSTLQSQSDIIRNPGFYGFTVYDIAGLADKQVSTENINGRVFDVHTIRKVQLYPLQPGRFSIDAMEIKNRVAFSRSAVNRKTEQQIAEGMMGIEDDKPVSGDEEIYETTMHTVPVDVEVIPLPVKSKPASFNGAVGRFSIRAGLPRERFARNEEGFLEVVISGRGNFTQLEAPVIEWPAGMEGFEPTVQDELDKQKCPLQGSRKFRFPFVCASAGSFGIPAVSLSFFDPDSNQYKTIRTGPVKLEAVNEVKKTPVTPEQKISLAEQNEKAARTGGLIAVILVLLILGYWIFGKKEKPVAADPVPEKPLLTAAEQLLQPVAGSMPADDASFYKSLQTAIWNFMAERFGLSGSAMNKQELMAVLQTKKTGPALAAKLVEVLETCETGIFTPAVLTEQKESLVNRVQEIFTSIDGWEAEAPTA